VTLKHGLPAAILFAAVASAQPSQLRDFDTYVERALRDWNVPGVAIAVVKNDSVVFAKGYGVRELGNQERVDTRTLFAIGSTTKAFTAAALAMLVDEKKLAWDDAATKFLPTLQLNDPAATRDLTVRDLLTHRTGLARGDRIWYASGFERDEVLRRVRFLKPTWTFRSTYGYQNIMFLAAGQVVQSASGKSWDDFVRERIFTPLGMRTTNTSVTAIKPGDNAATPHAKLEGTVRPIPWRNIDNVGPAGSINSNVLETAEWLRLQLGEGSHRGRKLLSDSVVKEMHDPQILVRRTAEAEKLFPMTHLVAYGLGWSIRDYRGRKMVGHGGGIDGFRAEIGLIPEEELGVVVLSNRGGNNFPVAIMYQVIDAYLGVRGRDWSALALAAENEAERKAEVERKKVEAARVSGTSASLPLDQYAGVFADSMYGDVHVRVREGKLAASIGPFFAGTLEHWHFNTFRATWDNPVLGRVFLTFMIDAKGKADALEVENLGTFRRKPSEARVADR
jgi:CubicO group peptidase (beta-lactamase class C family)